MKKKRFLIPLIICGLMIIVNITARCSEKFSDFYVLKIFPYISAPLTRFSALFPFSLGEILICTGILLVLVGIPLFIILITVMKGRRKKVLSVYFCTVLWIFTYILSTETLNCFVMYQCTPFSERYFSDSGEHNDEQLEKLYTMLIDKANKLSKEVPRDSENRFYLQCDYKAEAVKSMKNISEDYEQLSGYFPKAKPIKFSYFMSQSNLLGIYFPFSMEANYNADAVDSNYPSTICHELAHLKGVIQEDEANFISFIANINSDNAEFRYSGYLNALEYVHNEICRQKITSAYSITDSISDEVLNDWFRFVPDNYWEDNKEKEIISTEVVETVSDTAIDANIKMNGREDGIKTYSRVVDLLLDYYYK